MLELTPVLLAEAMRLANSHELRAYDAIQLAAVLELKRQWVDAGVSVVLVSADQDLNDAATVEGLQSKTPSITRERSFPRGRQRRESWGNAVIEGE